MTSTLLACACGWGLVDFGLGLARFSLNSVDMWTYQWLYTIGCLPVSFVRLRFVACHPISISEVQISMLHEACPFLLRLHMIDVSLRTTSTSQDLLDCDKSLPSI